MAKSSINKRLLLKKFVEFPKNGVRHFFSREMMFLNKLIERYSIEFLQVLSLDKKYDSLAVISSDSFEKELDSRFRNFNFKINESLYDKVEVFPDKFGEDLSFKQKPKTIKEFLNG